MNNYELKQHTYSELLEIEDRLRLEDELSTHLRPRQSGGRLVIFVLSVLLWTFFYFASALLIKNLKEDIRGIVATVFVFVSLGVSVVLSRKIWEVAPMPVRRWVRLALHYWPVTAVVVGNLVVLFKVGKG